MPERVGPRGRQQTGTTRFRVYFNLDNNDDMCNDDVGRAKRPRPTGRNSW
ncbi:MAG TPA: hypothetical protein VF173_25530 [Thermoanaerobaculia bacterium]|nr:hypothetical protein [Thermoanaerobaculia bacterium]